MYKALEIVRRINQGRATRWRDKANIGRKSQKVAMNQLVWIKRNYTTFQSDKKLGVKWVGQYKVKEDLRKGGVYALENTDGTVVQKAADKVKPYVGREEILVQP